MKWKIILSFYFSLNNIKFGNLAPDNNKYDKKFKENYWGFFFLILRYIVCFLIYVKKLFFLNKIFKVIFLYQKTVFF